MDWNKLLRDCSSYSEPKNSDLSDKFSETPTHYSSFVPDSTTSANRVQWREMSINFWKDQIAYHEKNLQESRDAISKLKKEIEDIKKGQLK